jgi:hypothetical protein
VKRSSATPKGRLPCCVQSKVTGNEFRRLDGSAVHVVDSKGKPVEPSLRSTRDTSRRCRHHLDATSSPLLRDTGCRPNPADTLCQVPQRCCQHHDRSLRFDTDRSGSLRIGHQLPVPFPSDKSGEKVAVHQQPVPGATQPMCHCKRSLAGRETGFGCRRCCHLLHRRTCAVRVVKRRSIVRQQYTVATSHERIMKPWDKQWSRSPRWVNPSSIPIARTVGWSSHCYYQVIIVLRRKPWPKNPIPSTSSSWTRAALPWGLVLFDACRSEQRPAPGLPDPVVLRLQVFSTS